MLGWGLGKEDFLEEGPPQLDFKEALSISQVCSRKSGQLEREAGQSTVAGVPHSRPGHGHCVPWMSSLAFVLLVVSVI